MLLAPRKTSAVHHLTGRRRHNGLIALSLPEIEALMAGVDLDAFAVLLPRPAWMSDAACREHPEVEFIPANPSTEEHADRARAICGRCLCRAECLDYAMADPSLLGVWGGTTSAGRRELRRRAAA